jgi:hypothetical protein
MIRFLRSIILFPLTGGTDWNARLAASLKPDPKYLARRDAGKRGWATRRRG